MDLAAMARSEPLGMVLVVALLLTLGWLFWLQQQLASLRVQLTAISPPGMTALHEQTQSVGADARLALARVDQLAGQLHVLKDRVHATIQHVGVVRFNPFRDTGGDQSFAVALLDEDANGVVISSLHNRNDTRIYAKAITGGRSTYTLSAEEQEAIQQAIQGSPSARDKSRLPELRISTPR